MCRQISTNISPTPTLPAPLSVLPNDEAAGLILAETHALLLNRLGRNVAWRTALELRRSSSTTIVRITPADERRAWEILEQYNDHTFSFTDGTSFAVMERLGIAYAFAFDGDFTEYYLILLQP